MPISNNSLNYYSTSQVVSTGFMVSDEFSDTVVNSTWNKSTSGGSNIIENSTQLVISAISAGGYGMVYQTINANTNFDIIVKIDDYQTLVTSSFYSECRLCVSTSTNIDTNPCAGILISTAYHADGALYLYMTSGIMTSTQSNIYIPVFPCYGRISRVGSTFNLYYSTNASTWSKFTSTLFTSTASVKFIMRVWQAATGW